MYGEPDALKGASPVRREGMGKRAHRRVSNAPCSYSTLHLLSAYTLTFKRTGYAVGMLQKVSNEVESSTNRYRRR